MNWIESEWRSRSLDLEPTAAKAGSPISAAEFEALRSEALMVPLTDSGRLRLTGADRIDFLHGQIANEVRGLRAGQANRSLLLNHKGHSLADIRVMRGAEELELIIDGGGLAPVEESLRRHIIFDQVELKSVDGDVLTLQGPEAEARLRAVLDVDLPGDGEFVRIDHQGSDLVVAASRRSAAGGFDLAISPGGAQALAEALLAAGAVAGGRPALELARIAAGLPSAAGEGGEGVLPQEAGLESLISYRKGCYLGQEIMARIEARGKLRRQLAALKLEGLPAEGERDIGLEGKKVGRLGGVASHPSQGVLALAVLRSDVDEGVDLEVGGVTGRRVPLPAVSVAIPG